MSKKKRMPLGGLTVALLSASVVLLIAGRKYGGKCQSGIDLLQ